MACDGQVGLSQNKDSEDIIKPTGIFIYYIYLKKK